MKFRLEKKEAIREIEESLANNKWGIEFLRRLLINEKEVRLKNVIIILLSGVGILLLLFALGIALGTEYLISTKEVVIFLVIEAILAIVSIILMYGANNELLTNEMEFINGLLKENAKYEEADLLQSGDCYYIEVENGLNKELVYIEDKSNVNIINSCKICYFKKLSWGGCNHDKILIKNECQILIEYKEKQTRTFKYKLCDKMD